MTRTLASVCLALCGAWSVGGCDNGGGTGAATGTQGQGAAGVPGGAGTTGTAGATGSSTGTPTAGATAGGGAGTAGHGTAGVDGTAGAAGHGTAGVDGTAGAAGHDTAGAGGSGGDTPATCDLHCDVGTHCELVDVQCIRAPCPPVEQCVEDPHCGGFAGFPCPGMGQCQDDPRDSCDPQHGGADCGGICACADHGTCADGQVWDASPAVCDCVAADGAANDGGEACGKTTCAKGMVCCNASCGICTPPDGACIQIACL